MTPGRAETAPPPGGGGAGKETAMMTWAEAVPARCVCGWAVTAGPDGWTLRTPNPRCPADHGDAPDKAEGKRA